MLLRRLASSQRVPEEMQRRSGRGSPAHPPSPHTTPQAAQASSSARRRGTLRGSAQVKRSVSRLKRPSPSSGVGVWANCAAAASQASPRTVSWPRYPHAGWPLGQCIRTLSTAQRRRLAGREKSVACCSSPSLRPRRSSSRAQGLLVAAALLVPAQRPSLVLAVTLSAPSMCTY